jgi:hypothetical protein
MPSPRHRLRGAGRNAPATRLALFLLCLVAPAVGCGREAPSGGGTVGAVNDAAVTAPDSPASAASAAGATPPPVITCVGTVREYCARLGGRCPTYSESVERGRALCPHWAVVKSACGHRYRSVSWREPVLGGGQEYFDPGGRLIGAYLYTDYWAYCDGSSFSETFGTVPTCPTRPLAVSACPTTR